MSRTHSFIRWFIIGCWCIQSLALFKPAPSAQAAIRDQSSSSPIASVVDCIQPGIERTGRSSDSPRYATTCFGSAWDTTNYGAVVNPAGGDADPSSATISTTGDAQPDGSIDLSSAAGNGHSSVAELGDVGAVYGLAYSSGTNPGSGTTLNPLAGHELLFSSAFSKRLTRFGPGGPGAVYLTDLSSNTTRLFAAIPGVVAGPATTLSHTSGGTQISYAPGDGSQGTFPNATMIGGYTPALGGIHQNRSEPDIVPLIGTTSLGDLEMAPGERLLFVTNLRNKRVFAIDTWLANPQSSVQPLPDLISALGTPCAAGGGATTVRPFGLAVDAEYLYLGFVCDASISNRRADLRAAVYRYNYRLGTNQPWSGSWDTTPVLSFLPTDYDAIREPVQSASGSPSSWQPWVNSWADQQMPLLSGLAFSEDGSLLIGLRSINADRSGNSRIAERSVGMGDLLLAAPDPTNPGRWLAPSSSGELFRDSASYDGPYPTGRWSKHPETSFGAVSYTPGWHNGEILAGGTLHGEVVNSSLTPYRNNSGGLRWYNLPEGGQPVAAEELYEGDTTTLSKAAGLGDVELLCAWRAIGDRVWNDLDGDGIQDAGEPGIDGVKLELRTPTNQLLASVTSGSINGETGRYRFYVNPFTDYRVAADLTASSLSGLVPTHSLQGSNDELDSDVGPLGNVTVANATTLNPPGGVGDITLSYDLGFTSGADVTLNKTAPASITPNTNLSYTLNYRNLGQTNAANVVVVDTLPAGVSYQSATPAPTSISGQSLSWNLGSLAAGASGSINLIVKVAASVSGGTRLTNSASISTSTRERDTSNNHSNANTTVIVPGVSIIKDGPVSALPGTTINYTLRYLNSGSATAAGVVVQDILPTGISYQSATPSPTTISGQTISWNLGNLAVGANQQITIVAQTASSLARGSQLINQASISTTTSGDPPEDNRDSAETVILAPELSLQKDATPVVNAGGPVRVTLTYRNSGDATAANVQITDQLPSGLSFVRATPAPSSIVGQTISWQLGNLAAGASGSISIDLNSSGALGSGTILTNHASISSSTAGDDPSNNQDSADTLVQRVDTYISKSSPTSFPVLSGSSVRYFLDYGNHGPGTAANVMVNDLLPSQLSGITWRCLSGCSSSGSGNLNLSLGSLTAGSSGRIEISGIATTNLDRVDFTNTASISSSSPELSSSNNSSSVVGAVWTTDVQLSKTADPQATAGDLFFATLNYRNNGPAAASASSVSDTLPAGVTLVSANPAPSSMSGNTITWNTGTLSSNASGSINLTLRSDPNLAQSTTITNTANVGSSGPDRSNSNNQSQAATVIVAEADLQLNKSATPSSVIAGDESSFTLTYRNNGPSVARNVVVRDTLPAGMSLVSATPAGNSTGQQISWNLGDLAPQASGSISIRVRTEANQTSASRDLVNSANISSSTDDPISSNNNATASLTVRTTDLELIKSMDSTGIAGQNISAILSYHNHGPITANNVIVRDSLPAGVRLVQATPAPLSSSGGIITWNLGSLANGASGSISITLQLDASLLHGSTITNQAEISSSSPDRDSNNNRDSAGLTVAAQADLSVVKSATPTTLVAGDSSSFTIYYSHNGPSLARSVIITDTLPAGLTLVSTNPAASSVQGSIIRWNLGDLPAGASGSITLIARSTRSQTNASQSYLNSVTIGSNTPDPDPNDNLASASITARTSDVRISKSMANLSQAGTALSASLSYSNNGPISAQSSILTDTLPSGLRFISANPAPTVVSGGLLVWNLGTLASGASGSITLSLQADASVLDGSLLTNRAVISSSTPDRDSSNNNAQASTQVQARADLHVSKQTNQSHVIAGELASFSITYRNNGPALARSVVITDTLPAGMQFSSSTPAPTAIQGQQLIWRLGDLVSGNNGSISLITRTDRQQNLAVRDYLNQVQIGSSTTDSTNTNNQGSASTSASTSDLWLSKAATAIVIAGDTLTTTLRYGNHGPISATSVVISDTLPSGLQLVSAAPMPTIHGNVLRWELGSITSAASGVISLTLRSALNLADQTIITNQAEISSSTPDRDSSNNNAQATTQIQAKADLALTKHASATVISAGDLISYTLSYRNNGPGIARQAVLSDTLPQGLSLVQTTPAPQQQLGNTLIWQLGDLANQQQGNITIVARSSSNQTSPSQTITNTAQISSIVIDPSLGNNQGQAVVNVQTADLSVIKTMPSQVIAGTTITATLVVHNAGPASAPAVVLTDTLPLALRFIRAEPTPAYTTQQQIIWQLGELAANQSITVTVALLVAPDALGSANAPIAIQNSAVLFHPLFDRDPINDQSSVIADVSGAADLVISKSNMVDHVQPGDQLTYEISVTNTGPSQATAVTLYEQLPISTTLAGWQASATDAGWRWSLPLGNLAVGETITRSLSITLPNPLASHIISNTIRVEAEQPDPDRSNNQAVDRDTVDSGWIGDMVWRDDNHNGLIETGEAGLANITVQLLDPQTMQVISTTQTLEDGSYHISGLRARQYAVQLAPSTTRQGSYYGYRYSTAALRVAELTSPEWHDQTADFGLYPANTTDIQLNEFQATRDGEAVVIVWRTEHELNTQGYQLIRADTPDLTTAVVINEQASLGINGGSYSYRDTPSAGVHFYWLLERTHDQQVQRYGPLVVSARPIYLPWFCW